jgi:hypothetical protein
VLLQGFSQIPIQSSKSLLGESLHLMKQFKEQMIHEQTPQEKDLEVSSNPYQQEDKINESWIISDEEQILEPKIEEFLGCLSPDPLCTQKYDDQFYE